MSSKRNDKCFSLIHGGEVRLAPKVRVVPADTFSTLLAAEEVLHKIKEDAERYRSTVALEAEQVKAQAAQEGFEEGFAKWCAAIERLEQHTREVEAHYREILVPVALKAAKKIVGKELERDDAIVDIVANALKAVAQHKKIVIYVNRKHLDILEAHRQRLKDIFEDLKVLSIREREDVAEGGCIIETEGGIINAQLSNQWEILEQAFDAMIKSKASFEEDKGGVTSHSAKDAAEGGVANL